MQPIKLIQNKIYKIKYTLDDIEYISYSKFNGENYFLDVITNKIYDIKEVSYIEHNQISKKTLKYFLKLYKKEKNINIFKSSNFHDINLDLYINVLRFFDLKDEDLFKNNKEKDIKEKVINKCKKYLKRYLEPEKLEYYINILNKFDDINYILSYKPLLYGERFFWSELHLPCINSEFILYNTHDNAIFEAFDEILNINVNEFLIDKQKYKRFICKMLENYTINLEKEYKEKITNILHDRIKKAKITIDNELEYANSVKDEDLLFELNVLKDTIHKTEIEINETCKNINTKTDFNLVWPDLLYPIDNITRDEFYLNNKHINTLNCILLHI